MTSPFEQHNQFKAEYDLVLVSDKMREAGIESLRSALRDGDGLDVMAGAVYLAMEYERMESLGQLTSVLNHPLKVRES